LSKKLLDKLLEWTEIPTLGSHPQPSNSQIDTLLSHVRRNL